MRITLECTQKCAHCCFECAPGMGSHMSPAIAADVARFAGSNGVRRMNVMGGEFFCNPDWEAVLEALFGSVDHARLVTNGDWAGPKAMRDRVVGFLSGRDNVHVALSFDKWHTNRHVAAAEKALKAAAVPFVRADMEDNTGSVPVGRHWLEMDNIYSMFSCWCHKPDRMYTFLIDEEGLISKCPFGMWTYDRIGHYLDGGFRERFKQFHSAFYKTFVPSCHRCADQWQYARKEMIDDSRE